MFFDLDESKNERSLDKETNKKNVANKKSDLFFFSDEKSSFMFKRPLANNLENLYRILFRKRKQKVTNKWI